MQESIKKAIETLGWDTANDEIVLEIAGTSVSGIDVGENYNKKWQSPLGTRKYNKDAFIIIKNQSRRDLTKSVAPKSDKEIDDEFGYDTSSK
mgnify:CR=1 FL=1